MLLLSFLEIFKNIKTRKSCIGKRSGAEKEKGMGSILAFALYILILTQKVPLQSPIKMICLVYKKVKRRKRMRSKNVLKLKLSKTIQKKQLLKVNRRPKQTMNLSPKWGIGRMRSRVPILACHILFLINM